MASSCFSFLARSKKPREDVPSREESMTTEIEQEVPTRILKTCKWKKENEIRESEIVRARGSEEEEQEMLFHHTLNRIKTVVLGKIQLKQRRDRRRGERDYL